MKGHICMKEKELENVGIFQKILNKQIKQSKAAKILGISVRQIKRQQFPPTGS